MKIGVLLLSFLVSGICLAQSDELWTFDDGYAMGEMYCVPGGLSLGQEHVSYWNQQGQVAYANGLNERLSFCATMGAFVDNSANVTLNDAICSQPNFRDHWPSIANFVNCSQSNNGGNLSDDSDNANP